MPDQVATWQLLHRVEDLQCEFKAGSHQVAIEAGSDTQEFGVVVPDFPGCFSEGEALDEALANAKAAGETRSGYIARRALA